MRSTDPIDWALDDDGHLIVPLRRISGVDGVRQRARIKLRLIRGEWFMDIAAGIPYISGNGVAQGDAILEGPVAIEYIESQFRSAIETIPGILKVTSLKATIDTTERLLTIDWRATVTFDDIPDDVIVSDSFSLPVGAG